MLHSNQLSNVYISFIIVLSLAISFSSCSKSSDKEHEEGDPLRDKSFTPPDGPIWHAAIQADGKILVAGNMYNVGTQSVVVVHRLSKDGVPDEIFNAHKDKWNYHEVNTLSLLNGGKVLLGGRFEVAGNLIPFLCLNADGSIDKSFVAPTGINEPRSAVTAPDGKIYMVGAYRYNDGTRGQFVIRLNADGKQEAQMQIGDQFAQVSGVALQSDGKVLVLGEFLAYLGLQATVNIVRLNVNLTLDNSFMFMYVLNYRNATPSTPALPRPGFITAAVQPDGKVIVAGNFIGYQDINNLSNQHDADGVLRLNPNGTIDGSFQSVSTLRGQPYDVEVLEDGRILVTHNWDLDYDDAPTVMYTNTGTRDAGFSLTDPHSSVYGVMKQAERSYLIWGGFTTAKGIWRVKL